MDCELSILMTGNGAERGPQVIMVGMSHKSAPVEVREALALADEEARALLKDVKDSFGEALFISTCNRAELYTVAEDCQGTAARLVDILKSHSKRPYSCPQQYFFQYSGAEAVQHLFEVTAGLDSMIIGEDQILGQVRRCFEAGIASGTVGTVLSQLARQALSVGKRVRTQTELGSRYASVGYQAVSMGEQHFGSLKDKTVLVIGAGKMGRMVGKGLHNKGVSQILWINRTFERAEALQERFGGRVAQWADLPQAVTAADLVISCTGADGFVLSTELVAHALRNRAAKPLVLVDIAVPRDVDPEVGRLAGVHLYDVDHLGSLDREYMPDPFEMAKAKEIVWQEREEFQDWQRERASVPVVRALLERAEAIRVAEMEKGLSRGRIDGDKERQVVDAITSAIVNKLLHPILIGLKKHDLDPTTQQALRSLVEVANTAHHNGTRKD